MDTIPRFDLGDKVRVMQTDEMVKRHIANVRGTVIGFDKDKRGDIARLSIEGKPSSLLVHFDSLMHLWK